MKLSKEIIEQIQKAAEKIAYGSITITFVEHLDSVDIEISERIRVRKGQPRPGEIYTH